MCFDILYNVHLKLFHYKENSESIFINLHRSTSKMLVILVGLRRARLDVWGIPRFHRDLIPVLRKSCKTKKEITHRSN